MLVTPGIGQSDGTPTVFQGDASATSDAEDAPGALTYSWDWDDDGVVDASGVTSTHTYSVAET
jgi:PKD domain